MCVFRAVLAVEPPGLAGRKKGIGKSEPADQLLVSTESCTRRFLQQITKYSHGEKGKKT